MRPMFIKSWQNITQQRLFNTQKLVKYSATRSIATYCTGGLMVFGTGYLLFHPKERKLLQSTLGSSFRFLRSLKIGLIMSIDYWVAPIIGSKETDVHQRSANRIVQGCLKNGGIYIKLGQGLAAVNHILPKEYIKTLSMLQDKCLTRDANEMEELFLQDFGKRPEEMLKNIEPEPVAAASLAQVYKAETMNGDPVAIKVQYIDLQDRFISDIKTVQYLLKLISFMHPKFNLHWVLEELRDTLAQELDFTTEGKNSERCAEDLKKFKYAHVPKVYWDLSSKRILTTEWIDGVKISDVEGMKKQGIDIADADTKLICLMAEQIFHTGFVHADPHPGNVLVRKGSDGKAQIVLLDHGLYEYLPEKTRVSLCNFWESLVLRDVHALQQYAKELNVNDHVLLAEMIMQAPFSLPGIPMNKPKHLGAREYMIQQAQERFDRITITLRQMPKTMMLVIRNLNTIRAITRDHGNIVDRYKLMARSAVSGKYQVANQAFTRRFIKNISKIHFELHLRIHSVTQWFFRIYLKVLRFIGYDIEKITEFVMV